MSDKKSTLLYPQAEDKQQLQEKIKEQRKGNVLNLRLGKGFASSTLQVRKYLLLQVRDDLPPVLFIARFPLTSSLYYVKSTHTQVH